MRHNLSAHIAIARAALVALVLGIAGQSALASPQEKAPKKPASEVTFGIQKRTYNFKEAGKDMEYALFVPSNYDNTKKWPLVVALHGLGSNPQQIIRYPGLTRQAEKYGYCVVAPMGYNSHGWYGSLGKRGTRWKLGDPENLGELSEKDVMNVLAIIRAEFPIDPNRIYLMGHSMGGGGTWHIAMKYPEIWAALAPIAPAIYSGIDRLEKIKRIPVIVVQGEKDWLVPASGTRKWVAKMKELGMEHIYIEVPDGDHVRPAFQKQPQIFEFFNKHRRRTGTTPKEAKGNAATKPESESEVQDSTPKSAR